MPKQKFASRLTFNIQIEKQTTRSLVLTEIQKLELNGQWGHQLSALSRKKKRSRLVQKKKKNNNKNEMNKK